MSRTPDPTIKIALLRAAEEVFAEKGLALAKVEEITRRAGTSKGAFYLHFESKEEAFKHVVESFLARCSALLPLLAGEEPPSDPGEAIGFWRDADERLYEFLWQNRAIVSILLGCQGEHEYLLEAFVLGIHRATVDWIERSKRVSLFRRDVDTELAATLLVGAHTELSRKMIASTTRPPIADWVRKAQAVFVRGLGSQQMIDALERIENPPVSHAIPRNEARRRRAKAS